MIMIKWRDGEHRTLCKHISAICGIFTWSAFHISTILCMQFYLHLLRGCMGFHIWYLHYYVYHYDHYLFLCIWKLLFAGNFGEITRRHSDTKQSRRFQNYFHDCSIAVRSKNIFNTVFGARNTAYYLHKKASRVAWFGSWNNCCERGIRFKIISSRQIGTNYK